MIRYQLICARKHEFEAWFRDGQTCDRQLGRRALECPVCGQRKIAKALMAPRVAGTDKSGVDKPGADRVEPQPEPQPMAVMAAGMREQLRELRQRVESNCDYVGERFAEEARRIHYGEADARGIYGEATDTQHDALRDEGIEVTRIPWLPLNDA